MQKKFYLKQFSLAYWYATKQRNQTNQTTQSCLLLYSFALIYFIPMSKNNSISNNSVWYKYVVSMSKTVLFKQLSFA